MNGSRGRFTGYLPPFLSSSCSNELVVKLVTDRFAVSNDTGFGGYCDTSWRNYCGGSWLGITQHLDYIQDMGFDAIWISPIVKSIEYRTLNGD
ncbi:hypothetical protein IW262DRAFT_1410477 [Armillaria fumosa]|nr:hypothetical protein IW262DRAFT_1410477 [Armillaria fumosa]